MDKNERVLTVAIIGAGSRGADSYGKIMNEDPRFKIVSVCDKRQVKLDAVKERFKISDDNLFLDEKDFLLKNVRIFALLQRKIKTTCVIVSPL